MSSELAELAANLKRDGSRIWTSGNEAEVSYPTTGHGDCFAIEDRSFWFQHRNRCLLALVGAFPPPNGGEILDIGGGNGVVSRALEDAGYRVVLLEPGYSGAINAQQRGVSTILCSTLQAAGFPDNCVPAAGLFDVLEHIKDPQNFLGELKKKLKPDGRLYLTVPAYSSLWSLQDIAAGHYRRYRMRKIKQELSAAGFTVDFSSYLFWLLPLPVFIFRALPFRLGLGKNHASSKGSARDHGVDKGLAHQLINAMLKPEERLLSKGRRIPFGGSCLIAASIKNP